MICGKRTGMNWEIRPALQSVTPIIGWRKVEHPARTLQAMGLMPRHAAVFCPAEGDARRKSVLAAPEPGVQNVAQPVAEQIGAEHDQHDCEGGKDAGRPGGCDIVAGVGHHFGPGRDQRRNAEAEESLRPTW